MNRLRTKRNRASSNKRWPGLGYVYRLPGHLLQVALTLSSDRCCGVVSIANCAAYGIVSSLRTPINLSPRRTTARGFLSSCVQDASARLRVV